MSIIKHDRGKYAWKKDRLILKDICFECESTKEIEYHHVVPKSKGGTKALPLCVTCHGKVHGRDFLNARELQKAGIARAIANGTYKGRRVDTKESAEKFLAKEKNQRILKLLMENKYTYEEISKIIVCSRTTIVKVVKAVGKENIIQPIEHSEKQTDTSKERRIKYREQKIIRLLDTKEYSHRQIAKLVKCNRTLVGEVAKNINNT